MTHEDFRAALEAKIQAAHRKQAPDSKLVPVILLERGPRYTRIVRFIEVDGVTVERSAYGFIENETGRLLKSDGWKRAAKGARGNLADANPFARCGDFSIR